MNSGEVRNYFLGFQGQSLLLALLVPFCRDSTLQTPLEAILGA